MSALVNYGAVFMLMQVENKIFDLTYIDSSGTDDAHGGKSVSLFPSDVSEAGKILQVCCGGGFTGQIPRCC